MAALDVHYDEPIKEGNQLLSLNNTILTPHIGGLSFESFQTMMAGAMENIKNFEKGNINIIEKHRLID